MSRSLLAIDTASPTGSVALLAGERLVGEILLHLKTTHSERLLGVIDQLLEAAGLPLSDLDALAVVKGPGSFTGLRVGMATAKGLALALDRPLVGISTLRTLAANLPWTTLPVCALLDARKNEVYAGLFRNEGGRVEPCGEERVLAPERLLQGLEGDVLFVGDGAERYRPLIVRQLGGRAHFAPAPLNQPRAALAAWLAQAELDVSLPGSIDLLSPVYIRPSEAELLWVRKAQQGAIEG